METGKTDLPPVRVPAEIKERLARVGQRMDRSVSYLIRLAVDELLAREEQKQHAIQQFRARVGAQGGTVLEPGWRGSNAPHHIRCAKGHDGYVMPGKVQQGQGICPACAGNPVTAETAFETRLLSELDATLLEKDERADLTLKEKES